MAAALVAPHLAATRRVHGSASYASERAAWFFANAEFDEWWAVPGQRSAEPPAAPEGLTYGQYLFRLHTPWQVAVGTARGLVAIHAVAALSFVPEAVQPIAIASRLGGWLPPLPPWWKVGPALAVALLVAAAWCFCISRADMFAFLAVGAAAAIFWIWERVPHGWWHHPGTLERASMATRTSRPSSPRQPARPRPADCPRS